MQSPQNTLAAELVTLLGLNRSGLIERWGNVFGAPPPKHLSVGFLQRALTYELQCKLAGAVPKRTERALRTIATDKGCGLSRTSIKPGSHLMREWNGRTYQVEVLETEYLMDGKIYASLSAIAKRITGAHWSGPRFFGVNR